MCWISSDILTLLWTTVLPWRAFSQISENLILELSTLGAAYSVHIIRRCRQIILLLRKCSSSYTETLPINDQNADSIRLATVTTIKTIRCRFGPIGEAFRLIILKSFIEAKFR